MSALRKQVPEREFALLELSAKFFRGLGDPTRLKILEILLNGEQSVSDLVRLLGIQQGRVSNHLACLKWCGYVATATNGRYTLYRIADTRVKRILQLSREMVAKTPSTSGPARASQTPGNHGPP
ncbi:MAG: metalloregulator ArsR/SmtB family transcription factor [Candidatus Methylomirabilis sp.]|nr:metalloregulator ArsR/SmtB family transcription factor [Candidatus Methylomirabilis sp.]